MIFPLDDLRDQVAGAIEATCQGRFQVSLILRTATEVVQAEYLLGKYGGDIAQFVTVKTMTEAGPAWRALVEDLRMRNFGLRRKHPYPFAEVPFRTHIAAASNGWDRFETRFGPRSWFDNSGRYFLAVSLGFVIGALAAPWLH